MYLIPESQIFTNEIVISKSRFIISVVHGDNILSARDFIDKIRTKFTDASHNCWAFQLGNPNDTSHIGMSDDGEPTGTAGKPMLNALRYSKIGEVVVVVTRYFGGIKLGTGGLVRAYGGIVKDTLEILPTIEKTIYIQCNLKIVYTYLEKIRKILQEYKVVILDIQYAEDILLILNIPEQNFFELEKIIQNFTNGQAKISKI